MALSLSVTVSYADNSKGEAAYASGDYALALSEFKKAAEKRGLRFGVSEQTKSNRGRPGRYL